MSYKKRIRNSDSTGNSRSKKSNRKRKFKLSSIAPALIIEGLAVLSILALFVGLRVDLQNQNQLKLRWDGIKTFPQEVAQQDNRLGQLTQPVPTAVQDQWEQWSCDLSAAY